ncbi:hypothetical protein H6F93_15175 [Leptolyngbya sp. FACHB-671]|uniref:hypothetical protein n=1 Tax=Leptolyngbya sp. FACHB-671 TaxID=2692812 RepID=UPI00168266C6|nr:hypothetical protein [Leptolyngbya sp. FACHB-671]MBD2068849.1 hypothetical protein [Leptolyngbya sp. FACHB-671]
MSADDLMARIDAARDGLREAREEALATTGALKGIYMAREQIGGLFKPPPLPPLPPLEERLRGGRSSSRASFAPGRINETAWREHLEHRARREGGRVVTEPYWKDPVTGRNFLFPGGKSRRVDAVYVHPNGTVDVIELKKSSFTATSPGAEAQRAKDKYAMDHSLPIGKKSEGFLSHVDNVVYTNGLPLLEPGGNTALPGAGERPTHVHMEPQSGKSVLRSVLRGGSRALGPLGAAVDLYYLGDAIAEDGGTFGENTKATVGGIAGGWGGAAAGAALGTVLIPVPVVGTVVGGIIGGIGGGLLGESLGELL